MEQFLTISEMIAAAKQRLPSEAWNYSLSGSETETTLRRNRAAILRYGLRPRVLRNVSRRSTAAQFLGHPLALPVMVAPVGSIALFDPDGALAVARAVARAGTVGWVSTVASPTLEDVMRGAGGPMVFQLYVHGDRRWIESLVDRAEAAGYAALCLTVDAAVPARTERNLRQRFFPHRDREKPNLVGMTSEDSYQAELTWKDVEWLSRRTRLPLILKGIVTPEDARMAVEYGAKAICVSNHGGRRLDHGPGTLDMLPAVAAAVSGKTEVIIDGGFLRGTDVIKALALGARAVLIGKLACWGLAAAGEAGLTRTLELLQLEIAAAMGYLGVVSPAELNPEYLIEDATPVPADPDDRFVTGLGG